MEYPKVRLVSPIPVELPEGKFIYLQDQSSYAKEPVLLPPEVFSVVQYFNGKRSIADIQRDYKKQYGIFLHAEDIRRIAEHLDQYFFMESAAFERHLQDLRAEFASLSIRPSSHKGAAYPDDKRSLISQLDGYFTDAKGPGQLSGPKGARHFESVSPLKAIMAPHIDIKAGGPTFAWAYHALAASDAELFVILGTSHVDMHNFLALTRKTFETPFGHVETDHIFVEALSNYLSYDPFEDELIHKSEHSIEFQVVFLQYLQQKLGKTNSTIKIVPILCGGSMYEAIFYNRPIEDVPQLQESITGLQNVLQKYRKVCVIASVDFSHVGVRYGDPAQPTPAERIQVEETDRNLLGALERADHQGFITQLQRNQNATQICGFAPIYIMLRLIEGTRGKLLHYDHTELSPGSFVSFASMVWKS